jgi:hypothetical protein
MPTPIDPPTLSLKVDDLVDWLELMALFGEFGVARVDELLGSLLELEETAEDDIGERDRQREQIIESLENEIDLRKRSLGEAYPFELSDTCEELTRRENWKSTEFSFYLVCLITSHVSGSPILRAVPTGNLLTRLRNDIFQIIATLGLAGLSRGPAFSVGWPRKSGETIVTLLERAAAAGGGFRVRNPPSDYISPDEKDGGVDVIAFTFEVTPPPTAFYFGQTASGKNWPGKPVTDHARVFSSAYMQDHKTGNRLSVTLIPYRVLDDRFWHAQHELHLAILDRLRLPLKALEGVALAEQGRPIDGSERLADISVWLDDFIQYAQAA